MAYRALFIGTVLAVWAAIAPAQSSWDRYEPGTLRNIIALHDSAVRALGVPNHPHWFISAKDFATRAHVIYSGESRPIDPLRTQIIRYWLRSAGLDTTKVQTFQREFLVHEGDLQLWLLVQKQVAEFFPKELRPGQVITLYVMWLGAYYDGGDITWGFVVNEFDADTTAR